MTCFNSSLPKAWRDAYRAAQALVDSLRPYDDPVDPAVRLRVQRARARTRTWITTQKALAGAGELPDLQKLFIDQIPDDWRQIDLARRRGARRSAHDDDRSPATTP